ncbi:collagen alpha-1(III) chain-like [Eschrichtius robustus]|uniref:collagen alpha-1(III) chain-like n=1 Tax=Eschrichtius robustus TaxID=9764 RepID=UPI0035C02C44
MAQGAQGSHQRAQRGTWGCGPLSSGPQSARGPSPLAAGALAGQEPGPRKPHRKHCVRMDTHMTRHLREPPPPQRLALDTVPRSLRAARPQDRAGCPPQQRPPGLPSLLSPTCLWPHQPLEARVATRYTHPDSLPTTSENQRQARSPWEVPECLGTGQGELPRADKPRLPAPSRPSPAAEGRGTLQRGISAAWKGQQRDCPSPQSPALPPHLWARDLLRAQRAPASCSLPAGAAQSFQEVAGVPLKLPKPQTERDLGLASPAGPLLSGGPSQAARAERGARSRALLVPSVPRQLRLVTQGQGPPGRRTPAPQAQAWHGPSQADAGVLQVTATLPDHPGLVLGFGVRRRHRGPLPASPLQTWLFSPGQGWAHQHLWVICVQHHSRGGPGEPGRAGPHSALSLGTFVWRLEAGSLSVPPPPPRSSFSGQTRQRQQPHVEDTPADTGGSPLLAPEAIGFLCRVLELRPTSLQQFGSWKAGITALQEPTAGGGGPSSQQAPEEALWPPWERDHNPGGWPEALQRDLGPEGGGRSRGREDTVGGPGGARGPGLQLVSRGNQPCWHPICLLTTCDTKARWFTHTRVNPGHARAARSPPPQPLPARQSQESPVNVVRRADPGFGSPSSTLCVFTSSPKCPHLSLGPTFPSSSWASCPPSPPSRGPASPQPVSLRNKKLQNEARRPHLGKPRAGLGNRICSAPPAPSRRLVAMAGTAPPGPRSRAPSRPPAGAGASLASRPRAPVREAPVRAEEGGDPEPARFSPGPRRPELPCPLYPGPRPDPPSPYPQLPAPFAPTPPPLPPPIPSPGLEPPLPPPIPGSPRARRRGSQAAARTHPRPAAGLSAPGPVETAGKAAPGRAWGERGDFGLGGPEGAPGSPRGSQADRAEARGKRASWVPARTRAGEDRDRVPRQDPIPGTDGVPRGVFYLHSTLRALPARPRGSGDPSGRGNWEAAEGRPAPARDAPGVQGWARDPALGPGASPAPAPSGIQLSAGAEGAEEVAKPSALTHAPGIPGGGPPASATPPNRAGPSPRGCCSPAALRVPARTSQPPRHWPARPHGLARPLFGL